MTSDERILRLLRTVGHTPARDRLVARFSLLGEHAAVWFAIGIVGGALDAPRRSRWARATGTVAATYGLNTVLKLLVRRQRPTLAGLQPLTQTPTRLSFPSAHASTAFAGALAYTQLGLPALPLYALAVKLSLSRLYLGVHYPSDVLAGALLGTAVAAARGTGADSAPALPNGSSATAASVNGHRTATATGGFS
ncbi:MAG TPA: phosphatase PAP2 family protein [Solirubrobacteraceae bacterium]|jgi:membrane-associated phospholipid phosphatase